MLEFFHQPGFCGTHANRFADITLTLMVLAAVLFTTGFALARKKRFTAHRVVQTIAAALNAIVVLWAMTLPFYKEIIQDFMGERPAYFYGVTSVHASIGLTAFVFGLFVTLRGNGLVPRKLKFKNYKPYMRAAYVLYLVATLVGVVVYLVWYVFIPNPPVYI